MLHGFRTGAITMHYSLLRRAKQIMSHGLQRRDPTPRRRDRTSRRRDTPRLRQTLTHSPPPTGNTGDTAGETGDMARLAHTDGRRGATDLPQTTWRNSHRRRYGATDLPQTGDTARLVSHQQARQRDWSPAGWRHGATSPSPTTSSAQRERNPLPAGPRGRLHDASPGHLWVIATHPLRLRRNITCSSIIGEQWK